MGLMCGANDRPHQALGERKAPNYQNRISGGSGSSMPESVNAVVNDPSLASTCIHDSVSTHSTKKMLSIEDELL